MTWFILDDYYYSPKAQIKRLWKRVYKISSLMNNSSYSIDTFEREKNKTGKLINSLLDYNFNSE